MDTLFNIPESLSPRLAWMRQHGIAVHPNNDGSEYLAGNGTITMRGPTEDDALTALALVAGIKLWNE